MARRIAVHSHVKGLGLNADGTAEWCAMGLVGQGKAREAAGLFVDLVKQKSTAGRALLLAGPPGTGKTAIAMAIAQELGPQVPFCMMSASEVHSAEVKKTEVLTTYFRKSIGLRIRERKEVFEGEVVDIAAEETENPHGGYGKSIVAVIITLKTAKGSKTLRLAPQVHEHIKKQEVKVGDVIFIEPILGTVRRIGRCDAHASEFDLETDEYVPLPKGEVQKKKEVVQDITLHDLDVANSKPQQSQEVYSVLGQFVRPRKTEFTEKLRIEVNRIVDKHVEQGVAKIIPGVLFIDEVHALDLDCFAYLNRALERENSPLVVFATNRGLCTVQGTADTRGASGLISPHGIPVDLLDRLAIIKTLPYTIQESLQILTIRSKDAGIVLTDSALRKFSEIVDKTSLRFILQILHPAYVNSRIKGKTEVDDEDVTDADSQFQDPSTSAAFLMENSAAFVSM